MRASRKVGDVAKKVRGLYQRTPSGAWQYDFEIKGQRFTGSTKTKNRRDAERWLAEFRQEKSQDISEFSGETKMSFGAASKRWWHERGVHRKDAKDMERVLAWLEKHIGSRSMLRLIDNNMVATLAAKRRGEGASPATVNRSALEPLRAILKRADDIWGQQVAKINWREHLLQEPQGRTREMTQAEEEKMFAALRKDFHPVAKFLLITGLRRAEACNLLWSDVDLEGGRMVVRGKGGTVIPLPLADVAMAVLRGEVGRHALRVFTYEVRHTWGGEKGSRVPIKPDTFSTAFWRARKAAGVVDLRGHDLRHTAATRMVRTTGNLGLAQKMLRHTDIATTMRYAHANESDLRNAMNKTTPETERKTPSKNPQGGLELPQDLKMLGQIVTVTPPEGRGKNPAKTPLGGFSLSEFIEKNRQIEDK